jgi:acetyltransferase-like isoleucine patch superfamily enzyme
MKIGTKIRVLIRALQPVYRKCKRSDSSFALVFLRSLYYRVRYHKILYLHPKVRIKGVKNIISSDPVEIGIDYVGFMHRNDKTYLNIQGKLSFKGNYFIARGCRFDIARGATVTIGEGGFINSFSKVIIAHGLSIGDQCSISWDCQFLDEDYHQIDYKGKKETINSIRIGNRVWIGCGVKIYKGTTIPDGCVIASDSVVKGEFLRENCLIGGNPARLIKENVSWS